MSKPVIEYLIHFDNKVEIFDNEESFKTLLKLNNKLIVEASRIIYENIIVDYKVKLSKTEKERFFELKILYRKEDVEAHFTSCLNLLSELNRAIYTPGKVRVYTLWNDLSFDYSKQAYPLIYEVENLMRKLITKFMLVNVGVQWSTTDLTEGIRKQAKGGTDEVDILYRLDFKDLSDVLLKSDKPKSSQKDINKLYQKIMEAEASSDLDINDLKNIVPQSNWQKYFSTLIQYDAAALDKSWSELYELRCKVAHNNFLDKGDYQEIIRLTEELKTKLQDAIEKLDEVEVSEEDKEDIIENVNEDITKQIIESELNNLNSERQVNVNNDSRIGSPRIANLDTIHQLGRTMAQVQDQITNIARQVGMATPGQAAIGSLNRSMDMVARLQDPLANIPHGTSLAAAIQYPIADIARQLDIAGLGQNRIANIASGMGLAAAINPLANKTLGMGLATAIDPLANKTLGMGLATAIDPMANITRGTGMAVPGQNPRIREARAQVNDEAMPKGMDKENEESEDLTDVQAIKDEQTLETPIKTEENLIGETGNIEDISLDGEG